MEYYTRAGRVISNSVSTNAVLHREDGPAIIFADGTVEWHIDGKLHRLDGPAVIWADGPGEWFINNRQVTIQISDWAKENNINLHKLSDNDKMLIKLIWG